MPGNKRYEDLELMPRRWFPLPRLDGYILREFMIKYSVLLLVFVILFILSDVYRDISDFLEANASWIDVGKYLAYRLPGNIRFILPITMLLGCMWTMATFGKNMEITAMRASGVSL
ncbi:MAG: LptF/LptG family permease, partial [Victivallaceae bacterium]|nr:LptF/LptG family permease [Victivallaceae bacterium]